MVAAAVQAQNREMQRGAFAKRRCLDYQWTISSPPILLVAFRVSTRNRESSTIIEPDIHDKDLLASFGKTPLFTSSGNMRTVTFVW